MQTTKTGRTGRKVLTRWLAATALVGIYCLSSVGIVMTTGLTSAQARGGRGGGRGFARGGGGRGFIRGGGYGAYYGGGCWWSRRARRWVCPYYY
jgi:hypothetical protein